MADYTVNRRAVAHARKLIDARQYVLRSSDWGERPASRPTPTNRLPRVATAGTTTPGWHRALTDGAAERRPRPATPSCTATSGASTAPGLVACQYRAAEWRHKAVERAARDLLQHLDKVSGTSQR